MSKSVLGKISRVGKLITRVETALESLFHIVKIEYSSKRSLAVCGVRETKNEENLENIFRAAWNLFDRRKEARPIRGEKGEKLKIKWKINTFVQSIISDGAKMKKIVN